MSLIVLRARAVCAGCDSRLPPRTDAWWDDATRTARCLSCARVDGLLVESAWTPEAAAPVDTVDPSEPAESVEPVEAIEAVESVEGEEPEPTADGVIDEDAPEPIDPDARPPLPARDRVTPLRPTRRPQAAVADARRFASQGSTAIDQDPDADVDDDDAPDADDADTRADAGHVQSAAELIGRLRSVQASVPPGKRREPLVVERPDLLVDRGPIDDTRVTQTLEAARIHGLEVLHGRTLDDATIEHLVVAVNGLWTVVEEENLTGTLEKRDLGDWFTADARLFIGDEDRTDLVRRARDQADAVRRSLASGPFAAVSIRPVVCFGTVPPGWVQQPFVVDGVSITWRNHLVEPMLDPVLLDRPARHRLVALLVQHATPDADADDPEPDTDGNDEA